MLKENRKIWYKPETVPPEIFCEIRTHTQIFAKMQKMPSPEKVLHVDWCFEEMHARCRSWSCEAPSGVTGIWSCVDIGLHLLLARMLEESDWNTH